MQALKLKKIGDSVGIVFPKTTLEQIGVNEGDSIFLVKTKEGTFQLTTYKPEIDTQMEIAKKGISKYKNTLKILAK